MCVLNHFTRVQLCVTLWTAACQAPLSGKNTGVDLHFLPQGIFPTQQPNPAPLHLPGLPVMFFTASATWEAVVSGVQQSSSVTHASIFVFFQTHFPSRLLQNIEYSFLRYRVGPCWLAILYIVAGICASQTPNLPLPHFSPLVTILSPPPHACGSISVLYVSSLVPLS